MPKTVPDRLEHFGVTLHQLFLQLPDHDAVTDTLDYLLGALFGLTCAHHLGFRDRKGAHFSVYRPHLANYALQVPRNQSVNQLWTAGFYFNSAIQRIASAFDRIPRMLGATEKKNKGGRRVPTSAKERMAEVNGTSFDKWEEIYDEVNAFKHDPGGRAAGRTVTMNDAIDSFDQLLTLLNGGAEQLAARY